MRNNGKGRATGRLPAVVMWLASLGAMFLATVAFLALERLLLRAKRPQLPPGSLVPAARDLAAALEAQAASGGGGGGGGAGSGLLPHRLYGGQYMAMCAAVKNQHENLVEWIEHHRGVGVGAHPAQPAAGPEYIGRSASSIPRCQIFAVSCGSPWQLSHRGILTVPSGTKQVYIRHMCASIFLQNLHLVGMTPDMGRSCMHACMACHRQSIWKRTVARVAQLTRPRLQEKSTCSTRAASRLWRARWRAPSPEGMWNTSPGTRTSVPGTTPPPGDRPTLQSQHCAMKVLMHFTEVGGSGISSVCVTCLHLSFLAVQSRPAETASAVQAMRSIATF